MRPRIRRTPSDELFIALRRRHHHRFSERFLFTLQSSTVTSGLWNSEQQHFFFAEAIFDCSPKIELLSTLPLGIYLFANDGESSASLQYFLMGLGVGGTIVLFVDVILLPMLAKRITVSVALVHSRFHPSEPNTLTCHQESSFHFRKQFPAIPLCIAFQVSPLA